MIKSSPEPSTDKSAWRQPVWTAIALGGVGITSAFVAGDSVEVTVLKLMGFGLWCLAAYGVDAFKKSREPLLRWSLPDVQHAALESFLVTAFVVLMSVRPGVAADNLISVSLLVFTIYLGVRALAFPFFRERP
ncbi:MAG: hypothetical protein EOQ65_21630 [Mesorhizobium sp.]|uniref:hypothetical protein n=1 Tax=Mesorhizobium sp. TaxID=1871066 RepID=UPI000FE87DA8|nr:hypothetical protein [Mesorhizobium sp.]RWG57980.1 MAG: hypothetical protein EOQ65_21630 [Mesorhizobium sp.]